MPPTLNVWSACRPLALRSRPFALVGQQPRLAAPATRASPPQLPGRSLAPSRSFSDESALPPRTPEQNQSAAAGSGPIPPPPPGGLASQQQQEPAFVAPSDADGNVDTLRQLQLASYGLNPFDPDLLGHKFGLPELPLEKDNHLKYRYSPVIMQITRLLMRDGKLSKAQRDMAMILNYLRTSPPPKINPLKPLLPGSPSPAHLPLNPVLYLTLAVDSVAPLIRISHLKGAAGGGHSLEVPLPLAVRQRRRIAFQWILDAVNKKQGKGSGRTMFPSRVGEEIVAVVEGRSGVWDKRQLLHKQGTAARANLNHQALRRR